MSRVINVEIWTEDEARDYLYTAITQAITDLSWVSPAPHLDDVLFEVTCVFEDLIAEAFYRVHFYPVEALTAALAEAAMAEKVLEEIATEISDAYKELYLSQAPTLQAL